MASLISDADRIIWRAYGEKIREELLGGIPPGEDDFIYICPPTQQGIAGGRAVPQALTNYQAYKVCDTLLPADSPLYVPGEGGSYILTLKQYLDYIKLPQDATDTDKAKWEKMSKKLGELEVQVEREATDAGERYAKDPRARNQSFAQWARRHAQAYVNDERYRESVSSALNELRKQIFGVDGAAVKQLVDGIELALEKEVSTEGYNMPCTDDDIEVTLEQINSGQVAEEPANTFFMPQYGLKNYESTIQGWVTGTGGTGPQWKLNLSSSSSTDWSSLGHQSANFQKATDVWIFFSQSDSHQENIETLNLQSNQLDQQIELTITMKAPPQKIDVLTGVWDVPGVRRMYPNLRQGTDGTPLADSGAGMIKVEQLLMGYGIGLEAKFFGSAKSQVASFYRKATADQSRGTRVFGIQFGEDRSSASTVTSSYEKLHYNEAEGTMSIEPVLTGYPILLGLLGRRLQK